jgi:hypothetical protein
VTRWADPWPTTFVKWQGSIKNAGKIALKPWKAPRLYDEGRPFNPTEHEVGAWVAWEDGADALVGQVWALAPRRGCVWVVDLEQRSHDVYVEKLRPAIAPSAQLPLGCDLHGICRCTICLVSA